MKPQKNQAEIRPLKGHFFNYLKHDKNNVWELSWYGERPPKGLDSYDPILPPGWYQAEFPRKKSTDEVWNPNEEHNIIHWHAQPGARRKTETFDVIQQSPRLELNPGP